MHLRLQLYMNMSHTVSVSSRVQKLLVMVRQHLDALLQDKVSDPTAMFSAGRASLLQVWIYFCMHNKVYDPTSHYKCDSVSIFVCKINSYILTTKVIVFVYVCLYVCIYVCMYLESDRIRLYCGVASLRTIWNCVFSFWNEPFSWRVCMCMW